MAAYPPATSLDSVRVIPPTGADTVPGVGLTPVGGRGMWTAVARWGKAWPAPRASERAANSRPRRAGAQVVQKCELLDPIRSGQQGNGLIDSVAPVLDMTV